MEKTTLVLGASPNAHRYSHRAILKLRQHGHGVTAFGPRKGTVGEVAITQEWPTDGVDTVAMYIGPAKQPDYYQRIIVLRPRRVIFNPGTENAEFTAMLREAGIEALEACTLVMLSSGAY